MKKDIAVLSSRVHGYYVKKTRENHYKILNAKDLVVVIANYKQIAY